jgi:transcriptional regulator with XRE-family HTH domain
MNKLDAYLKRPGVSASQLAEQVGCDAATIWRLRKGRPASLRVAIAIERATDGNIRASDLVGPEAGK